jgi:hypothetical protein
MFKIAGVVAAAYALLSDEAREVVINELQPRIM